MDNVVSRFLSFEETLGKGLVKFAYFVILIGLAVWAVIEVIGGVILLFDDVAAGLWEIVHTPFELVLWVILLRVATEVVLAILSIDDNLTESAVAERQGREKSASAFAATATPSVTAAQPRGDADAASAATATPDTSKASSASSSSSAATTPARKTPATKTTKKSTKAAKKTTKKASPGTSAASSASSASTKATVKAASASPASARSVDDGADGDTSSRGGDADTKGS